MEAITTAMGTCIELAGTMLTAITNNAILVVILGAGFVSLALRVLRRIVRTSNSVG